MLALIGASLPLLAAIPDPVTVLIEGGRREVPCVSRGGAELVPLEPVVAGLGVTLRPDPKGLSVKLTAAGREVTLFAGKSLASVGGDLRLLSAATLLENGQWLVPVDSLPRVLGPLLNQRVEWRPSPRALVIGAVVVPRLTVSTAVSGDRAEVVLEASRPLGFEVSRFPGRVTVTVPGEVIDAGFDQQRLTGGIVDSVRFVGGRNNEVAIILGPRFQEFASSTQGARLSLSFGAAGPAPRTSAEPSPGAAAPPVTRPAQPGLPRTVVIDPGHGGGEVGAQGPAGNFEKDVTLAVSRRLRTILVNTLGAQVFLTRDKDEDLGLDERAAFANNYKADLFLSIHANASRASSAKGFEVYFLSPRPSDEESRRVAAQEGDVAPAPGVAPSSDLALILWDMAQAEHAAQSSVLAARIEEELARVMSSEARGVKQAPFRVLVGATMPAVLVELAFISNPDEEKQLVSEAYQARLADGIARGVARFLRERDGAPSTPVSAPAAP